MASPPIRQKIRISRLTTDAATHRTTAGRTTAKRTRLPLILGVVVAVAVVPSISMLFLARTIHISKVEAQPHTAGAHTDRDQAARAALAATGFRFQLAVTGQTVTASISGQLLQDPWLELYRPDNPAGDRMLPWVDQSAPLSLTLDRPGRWRVRLSGVIDGARIRLADTPIESEAPSH